MRMMCAMIALINALTGVSALRVGSVGSSSGVTRRRRVTTMIASGGGGGGGGAVALGGLVRAEAGLLRGRGYSAAEAIELRQAVASFESGSAAPAELDVSGSWRLLATLAPEGAGENTVPFFSVGSWRDYLSGDGPSPVQSLFTGASSVGSLRQVLTLGDRVVDSRFDNVVNFQLGFIKGDLVIRADLEKKPEDNLNLLTFRFKKGNFYLNTIWGGTLVLPYPVPFGLLGDRAVGSLETTGWDEAAGLRVARGNKGTVFVFEREEGADDLRMDEVVEERTEAELNSGCTLRSVIVCPAQFGGAGDYVQLAADLRSIGHPVFVCDLGPFDWLSIAKSLPTEAYFNGKLEPAKALGFYYKALDAAVGRTNDGDYAILAHSIGGWVARAWLGETSETARSTCRAFVTLGTPHLPPPPDTIFAKIDQTRGLLDYVNTRWPDAKAFPTVKQTCVASTTVQGKLPWQEASIDQLLGYTSYIALGGDGTSLGDGITPFDCAFIPGAEQRVLEDAYHADFLPNPIGPSTKLLGAKWYGAPKANLDIWVDALSA